MSSILFSVDSIVHLFIFCNIHLKKKIEPNAMRLPHLLALRVEGLPYLRRVESTVVFFGLPRLQRNLSPFHILMLASKKGFSS